MLKSIILSFIILTAASMAAEPAKPQSAPPQYDAVLNQAMHNAAIRCGQGDIVACQIIMNERSRDQLFAEAQKQLVEVVKK